MSSAAEKILQEALALPDDEREHLVAVLLAAIRHEPQADIAAAWEEEILRRIEAAEQDGTRGVDWDVACSELRAKYAQG